VEGELRLIHERRTHSFLALGGQRSPTILNQQQLAQVSIKVSAPVSERCKNNETLETDFRALIATLPKLERTSDEIVVGIFKELTSKLANTRINEFLNPKSKRDLRM